MTRQVETLNEGNTKGGRIEYVAYSRLVRSPLNVRRKPPTGIEPLAETIAEKGLIQNLAVHTMKGRGK
ncbi:ParB N-terminal domain-containing protein [Paraburkholderia sediminicola]|uniref:hypothetical protein n=1 Tax=Paraburkholderia sediminicola TaxID=458836 RepID=UPI0038B99578